MNAKRKKTLFKIADRVWDDMILLLREEGPDSVLVPPESTTTEPLDLSNPDKIPYKNLPNNIRAEMDKLGTDDVEVFDEFHKTWMATKWSSSKDRFLGIYRAKPEPTHNVPIKCNDRCLTAEKWCLAGHEGWRCSLPKGHEGRHIACTSIDHNVCSWPQTKPESTTKSKTVVTQPELDALDESISVWQKRVAILNEDYTKIVHKNKCPCCEHGKEIGGLSACSFCAIGKAGYIECRGTGYYIKGTIRKGTKEYRDAYRKILCKLMEIRLNCEVICPRRQRSQ